MDQNPIIPTLFVGIAAALATRFDKPISIVKKHLKVALIEQWGKVRRTDSDTGDTMCASSMMKIRDDRQDAPYVRVCDSTFLLDIC